MRFPLKTNTYKLARYLLFTRHGQDQKAKEHRPSRGQGYFRPGYGPQGSKEDTADKQGWLRSSGPARPGLRLVVRRHFARRPQPERQLATNHRVAGHRRHVRGFHTAARPTGNKAIVETSVYLQCAMVGTAQCNKSSAMPQVHTTLLAWNNMPKSLMQIS